MGNKQPKQQEPQKSAADQLFETIFEFKMQAKELSKLSKKAERERDQMYNKVKSAIERINPKQLSYMLLML